MLHSFGKLSYSQKRPDGNAKFSWVSCKEFYTKKPNSFCLWFIIFIANQSVWHIKNSSSNVYCTLKVGKNPCWYITFQLDIFFNKYVLLIPHSHWQTKPAETKPGYRMEPSDWSVQQIEYISLVEIWPRLNKAGLACQYEWGINSRGVSLFWKWGTKYLKLIRIFWHFFGFFLQQRIFCQRWAKGVLCLAIFSRSGTPLRNALNIFNPF